MKRSVATIKKFFISADIRRIGEYSRIMIPYLACALYLEIFHQMISVFYVYGKWIGIPIGIAAAVLLGIAIIGAFFSSDRSRIVILLLFDVHISLTAAMLVRMTAGIHSGVPVWIIVSRSALFPFELCAVLTQTRWNASAD